MLPKRPHSGLCATCHHARKMVSDRGSEFWLCRRGLTEPEFLKYPKLPVLRCRGFELIVAPTDAQADDPAPEPDRRSQD